MFSCFQSQFDILVMLGIDDTYVYCIQTAIPQTFRIVRVDLPDLIGRRQLFPLLPALAPHTDGFGGSSLHLL